MPTHDDGTRDKFCTDVTTDIDAGAGVGNFVLRAAGAVEVATCPLSKPSFDAPASGVMALDVTPAPEDADATGGTVTTYGLEDSVANVIVTGPESELTISVNPIPAGSVVTVNALSYTASP